MKHLFQTYWLGEFDQEKPLEAIVTDLTYVRS